ncbi:hypothetical protein [Mucilaginibacter sp. dw_454]|uniref:hypothetical protein n=1 Tax=Mucilaginibacter sp. dw_454 TaxID=2720079 RepID=UPI001BD646C1|nr:hypothetical protein [Mucilaginibacter sp. dw_454]
MDDHFNFYASKRTDQELEERIDNRQKYLPETIEASLTELQSRGRVFGDEELQVISQDIQAQRDNASATTDNGFGLFSNSYKNCIVEDPDAPSFYSKRAVYVFTVLFSVVFGAVMVAINLFKIKNTKGALLTLLFGGCFLAFQILLTLKLNPNSPGDLGFVFGIAAAIIINAIFWPMFIGNSTFYRARLIWVPLAIALLLVAFVVWSTIVGKA